MRCKWMYLFLTMVPLLAAREPQALKVETTGPCTSPEISDEVKKTLQPQGFRISDDSSPFCEVWLRSVIAQKPGSSGTDYGNMADGTLAGVIIYSKKGSDYRGQNIAPGTYTMRYQTMPSDGNHMGVSPTSDYFLLCPAGDDKNPDAVFEYMDLVNLSRKASKTSHPAPLYLVAPAGGGKTDVRNSGGQSILEIKTKAKPSGGTETDFPIAIVLIGKGEAA